MGNELANSKRIAKNTLLLYFRMILMMIVTLYTSRVILNALGIEDFGIYNVVGGVVAVRIGVMRTLFLGAVLSAATNLLFAALALRGHDMAFLVFTVSADNLAAGIASVAFLAYLSGLTNVAYSATQYALFSSVMLTLPKFLAGFSGAAVESLGYNGFFTATACLGIPVLFLVAAAALGRKKLSAKTHDQRRPQPR